MSRTLIGTRIRARREALGLRQAEVARRAGISPSYLNLIEHNRRGIAGKVLIDIANVLEVEVGSLSHAAQTTLIQELQAAAATSDIPVELARTEEMVGRFPGWARLTAQLNKRVAQLERTVDGLSDRLTHDPFLSESLHEMLSNVTAIRSTSSILAKTPDIAPRQRARFHTNLFDESQRLSDISLALVSYFDGLPEGEQSLSTPLDEFEAFLAAADFHFAPLEGGDSQQIAPLIESSDALASQASLTLADRHLTQYCRDARHLPLAAFLPRAGALDFAPQHLAAEFQVDLPTIFRRLATLPPAANQPSFGLVVCDGSGTATLRKPLPGFSLPRYGAACPLWPLYQAIAQPHIPQKAILETPDGGTFMAYAQCLPRGPQDFDSPRVLEASMLFEPMPSAVHPGDRLQPAPRVAVGLSCRICPRETCPARREPSIHNPAD